MISIPNNCGPCTCQASGGFACAFVPCPKDGEAPRDGGVCTDHKSCNEDPAISTVRGMCLERGLACHCGMYPTSPYTGRCLNPGDDGSGCEYGGTTYSVGSVVPVLGCMDRCSCTAPGAITCPTGACLTCALTDDYSFSLPDGRSGYFYRPGTNLSLVRPIPGSDVASSCSAALPACGTANAVDTSELAADLAHAEVQQALAGSSSPVYGDRDRSAGAPMFTFRRSAGGSFSVLVGRECTTRTGTCEPTPEGVRRLVDDVNAVVAATLATPGCANLR